MRVNAAMDRPEHEWLLRCALPHRMADSLATIGGLVSFEAAPAAQAPTKEGLARVLVRASGSSRTIAQLEILSRPRGSGDATHRPVEVMTALALLLSSSSG